MTQKRRGVAHGVDEERRLVSPEERGKYGASRRRLRGQGRDRGHVDDGANAVIGEGHNDRARNTTTLQMLNTRDLTVCLSRDVCSPRETSSLPLS